ncbi:MAG: hypothetical protein AAGE52_11465 [Myxococcota bacterium]
MAKTQTRVRPLLVRPGARYTCAGDGLCCTDIHGLGPLTKKELVQIRKIDPDGAGWDDDFEERMLTNAPDGGCHFLLPDLRCGVHATFGPEAKPEGCRRFPLGLVATPQGGRITTEHRCPCRTMGDRPILTQEAALPSLLNSHGNPRPDRRVKKVKLAKKTKVNFDEWRAIEARLLGALAEGLDPDEVLSAEAFPRLKGSTWIEEFDNILEEAPDGTAFGFAAVWFAETGRGLLNEDHVVRLPQRPWTSAFERAESRPTVTKRSATEVFADWIADEIWSLKWSIRAFDIARSDLTTRLAIGRDICERLIAEGIDEARAAAEAVMVVELLGESDFWTDIADKIRVDTPE